MEYNHSLDSPEVKEQHDFFTDSLGVGILPTGATQCQVSTLATILIQSTFTFWVSLFESTVPVTCELLVSASGDHHIYII